jgi:hypothetical protein
MGVVLQRAIMQKHAASDFRAVMSVLMLLCGYVGKIKILTVTQNHERGAGDRHY